MESKHRGCMPKILVVDDHEASARHLLRALSGLKADIRCVDTGLGALRTAVRWLPRLIFMDLHLPDSNGLEIAREIRKRWPPSQPPAKIALLSAEKPDARKNELDAAGIDHALTKPAPGDALLRLASDVLGQSPFPPGQPAADAGIRTLFTIEIEQKLDRLEQHLMEDNREEAAFLVHQLIASAAMTGEKKLEKHFIGLNRLLRQTAGAAELARAYYGTHRAAQAFVRKSCAGSSG